MTEPFAGSKVMLFAGDQMLILRRDHTPGIPWPGYLDFPGGEADPGETPETCALRETREELGLVLDPALLQRVTERPGQRGITVYFAAHGPADLADQVIWGGEGAGWSVMSPEAFVNAQDAIPHFREILAEYLSRQEKTGVRR